MTIQSLDPQSSTPPFEQLRLQIARRASSGDLPAGTKLPTVRALAEQLGLAANTVARAYRELEQDGVVETQGRRGTVVAGTAPTQEAAKAAADFAAIARRQGLSKEQAQALVGEQWGH